MLRILRRWPRMELLEVVTIGFPFCCFKVLAGVTLVRVEPTAWGKALGTLLVALAALDFLINALNLMALVLLRRRVLDACLLSVIFRRHGRSTAHPESIWRDFGNSVDVLLSFIIVAAMVGSGVLGTLSPAELTLWNACVVFNVLGAGLSRFGMSLKRFNA